MGCSKILLPCVIVIYISYIHTALPLPLGYCPCLFAPAAMPFTITTPDLTIT